MITLNELQDMWVEDCKIDDLNLGPESTKTPELHAKLSDARTELDPVIRGQHYQKLDKMLTYDLVLWIPVWHPIYYYAVSENLGGYEPPNAFSPNLTEPARYWSKSGE